MLLIIAVTALLAYMIAKTYMKARRLPPGPLPLPLLGNLIQIFWSSMTEGSVIRAMEMWRKTYGDVYTLWVGPVAIVNICKLNIANESVVKNASVFSDRFQVYRVAKVRNYMGIVWSKGPVWQEQRRFALHAFRNFGLGKNIMEQRIRLELHHRFDDLDNEIAANGGEMTFDPKDMIALTTGTIINQMLLTDRFNKEKEKEFFSLLKAMDEIMDSGSYLDIFLNDFTVQLPFFKQRWASIAEPNQQLVDFFHEEVELRKADIASGKHILEGDGEDFLDAFLMEMDKSQAAGKDDSFNQASLVMTMVDVFFAGQDTTSSMTYWAIAYILLHPEVHRKLQQELDKVVSTSELLTLANKTETPYLNAVILETLRLSRIFPMGQWRETNADTVIGEYTLKKGTVIAPQGSLIMNDVSVMKNVEEFNPDRYLDKSDDKLEQYIIAFGLGKRACIGESLARAQLYLILGNFLRRYSIQTVASAMPAMKAHDETSACRRPHRYEIQISRRS